MPRVGRKPGRAPIRTRRGRQASPVRQHWSLSSFLLCTGDVLAARRREPCRVATEEANVVILTGPTKAQPRVI